MHNGVKTVAFGHAGNDILKGSKYDNVFEGGTGDDTLSGGGGNDKYVFAGTFPAGAMPLGTDTISNEAANVNTDTLDFSNFTSGVSVDIGKVYNSNNANSYAVDRGEVCESSWIPSRPLRTLLAAQAETSLSATPALVQLLDRRRI